MEVRDIIGNTVLPGDIIIIADKPAGNGSPWLKIGQVKHMKETPLTIKVEVEITLDGHYTYDTNPEKGYDVGKRCTLIFGPGNTNHKIYKITDTNLY